MSDRKMIKWKSFDSVMNLKLAVTQINNTKNKITMPILSEDQLEEIQYNVHYALFHNKRILIKYYKNGYYYTIEDYIIQIDTIKKRMIFKNHSSLFFNQIIETNLS